MKKIMLVGAVGTGKTTLTQRLKGQEISYHKTQAIQFEDVVIDTPGEFTQRRQYYSALQVTSTEADVVGLLQSVGESFDTFPPGFSSMFSCPSIGIITKVDLAENEEEVKFAELSLLNAGAVKVFKVSSTENEGIQEVLDYLKKEEK
ncbi:EutP/PduV family microcompartment system protein [Vagococcus fessus]|uniref:Ethanolamine utilization protein EutP n=1 Tax=Vagococcus fessus TaxID=120370 RepID=A0A430AC68_9ENTE|nr:EutP/PduV family microcompartment system protein [Vagococcus fessus]RSU04806.1 ethanolamine utilization protein EutP [Vagococcus fessus]